jgi:hypothetical protein
MSAVREPATIHTVTLQQFERWLGGPTISPNGRVNKTGMRRDSATKYGNGRMRRGMVDTMPNGILLRVVFGMALSITVHTFLGGWWLNEGQRVAITLAVAAGGAVLAAPTLLTAVAFGFGMAGGMAGVLLVIGPGTIFPIVIVIGTMMIGTAVVVGFAVGWVLRQGFKATRSQSMP